MKRNVLAIILATTLVMMLFSGCSDSSDSDTVDSDTEVVYGEVSSIEDGVITIKVGTQKEMESDMQQEDRDNDTDESGDSLESSDSQSEAESGDISLDENAGQPEGEEKSMLELTGEEQEIEISDDTVIVRGQMGGGRMSGGGKGGNGNMPEGESRDENATMPERESMDENATPPDMPEGESMGQKGEEQISGESMESTEEEITIDDISEGDIIAVTFDEDGNVTKITVMSMGGGENAGGYQASGVDSYTAVVEYTTDTTVSDESFESTGTDENAIHVLSGAEVILNNISVTRTSSDSTGGDNSSFYGVGSALLTTEGISYISNSTITTDAAGGAGIFAYGDGIVYTSDSTISTKQDTSGGIHVAGGGTLYAWDMTVETARESSAAIRSDRGSGTMVVDGGTYTSNGTGSPAIYSTADITVNDAKLTANASEAICIEGFNSIRLFDSDLTGNMSDDSQNDCTWNVILYQSMSGDSQEGNSTFEMSGGSLTAENGGMFYTTNTESTITLSDVDITYSDDSGFFLRCTGNNNERGWGTVGDNGADCLFTAIDQEMEGTIVWDSISQLDFYMTGDSVLKGAVEDDETYAGDGGEGYCSMYIEKGSKWIVTSDSTLSNLYSEGTIEDEDGNSVTVQGSDGTVYVEGDSEYVITVDSYDDSVDVSQASTASQWSDYQIEKPASLS